jgi:hypothetical protein
MNYNNKKFRVVQNSVNGEITEETIFEYKQVDNILTSEYRGGQIVKGHLIGLVDAHGNIEMRYHQVNIKGELMAGTCISNPQRTANCKIRLYEDWVWISGNQTNGTSILEEV